MTNPVRGLAPTDVASDLFGPAPSRKGSGHSLTSVYVPTRDGTRLAVDVYLPTEVGHGQLRTLLVATPYYRRLAPRGSLARGLLSRVGLGGDSRWWPQLAEYGFATVVMEQRGCGASFGQRALSTEQTIEDLRDVIDWIVGCPWSDGRVAAAGVSAVGLSAQLCAASAHPALTTVIPMFSSFDVYAATHPGGLSLTTTVGDVVRMMRALDANQVSAIAPHAIARLLLRILVRGLMPVDADTDEALLRAAVADHVGNTYHPALTGAEYRDDVPDDGSEPIELQSPHTYAAAMRRAGVRIASYAGWWDTTAAVEMLQAAHTVSPHNGRVVLGPWGHAAAFQAGPYLHRARKRRTSFDFAADIARVLGQDDVVGSEILYWTFGAEQWNRSPSWPVPAQLWTLYLTAEEQLAEAQDAVAGDVTLLVDPTASTPATSRWGLVKHVFAGVRYPAGRGTGRVLAFTGESLREDIEVTGQPQLTLHLTSSEPDGALMAYVLDVAPDGTASYVTEGVLRLANRKTGSAPYESIPGRVPRSHRRRDSAPMREGAQEVVVLDLQPISYLFPRGHRVRLELSGADAAHIQPPPGTSPGRFQVHTGGSMGSLLQLPIRSSTQV